MKDYDYMICCDRCGRNLLQSKAKKTWDNFIVCPEDFETRHIADRPPPVFKNEGRGVRDARPEPSDVFVETFATNSSNWKSSKVWGADDNCIWGGVDDPSIWGEDI